MAFISKQERDELVENITKSLQSNKPKKEEESKPEDRDEERISGEIPLDEVLPPSHGRETGLRVPSTSAHNQPYKGGLYIESIEDRLFRLLENVNVANDPKSSVSANQSVDVKQDERPGQKQVGTTEVLGHTKAKGSIDTPAKKQQAENSSFAVRGEAEQETEEESSEEMLKGAIEDLGTSGEAQITPSA